MFRPDLFLSELVLECHLPQHWLIKFGGGDQCPVPATHHDHHPSYHTFYLHPSICFLLFPHAKENGNETPHGRAVSHYGIISFDPQFLIYFLLWYIFLTV